MGTLGEWIADIDRAAASVGDEAAKVVSKGALNVKNDWRDRWKGFRHAPLLPYTINYDVNRDGINSSAEIGPDKGKEIGGGKFRTPGHLGAILEFGTPRNAPHPGGMPALDAEEPRFTSAIEDVGENLLAER